MELIRSVANRRLTGEPMRPPVQHQSALRTPLNEVFGTEGAVRLLRALALARAPKSVGVLVRQTRLGRSATRRAVDALLDTGLVDVHGEGRARHYTLRQAHPLAPAIMALFEAEQRRAEAVLEGIQRVVEELTPPPIAVWLEGAVAAETDRPGEPLIIRVVDSERGLRATLDRIRQGMEPLEEAFDVTIEVTGATRADLASHRESIRTWEAQLRSARSIAGVPPTAFLPHPPGSASTQAADRVAGRIRTHADLDERSLVVAAAVAERLRRDPTLVARAREFVERRLRDASPQERHDLHEWEQLLRTASPERLRRLLVDRSERATRLRQTLPFLGVLEPEERQALLERAGAKGGGREPRHDA
jgi:hypothetical protein